MVLKTVSTQKSVLKNIHRVRRYGQKCVQIHVANPNFHIFEYFDWFLRNRCIFFKTWNGTKNILSYKGGCKYLRWKKGELKTKNIIVSVKWWNSCNFCKKKLSTGHVSSPRVHRSIREKLAQAALLHSVVIRLATTLGT